MTLVLWPYTHSKILQNNHNNHNNHNVASAAEIGFQWDPLSLAWSRPDLPLLSNLAGPVQHFRAAILDAWQNKAAADLCGLEGFRFGPLLDIRALCNFLTLLMFVIVIWACFEVFWLGVYGMVFC